VGALGGHTQGHPARPQEENCETRIYRDHLSGLAKSWLSPFPTGSAANSNIPANPPDDRHFLQQVCFTEARDARSNPRIRTTDLGVRKANAEP
jgi:hypothetical protein